MLRLSALSKNFGGLRVLDNLDLTIPSRGVFGLIGPNGAGKTTFLDIPRLLGECLQQREVGQAFTAKIDDRAPRSSTLKELTFCGYGNEFVIAIELELPESVVNALLPFQRGPIQNDEKRWLRFEAAAS